MAPKEALGAFTENLDRRFSNFDVKPRNKIIEAMKGEDKILSQYIERNQLAKWVTETHKVAEIEVYHVMDEATEERRGSTNKSNGSAGGAALFGRV